ncbi:MAG: ABC transporter substrate-binding protein [Anaerolineales bacterium]|nr:ABC transporter substrate-binding protein [Chloroflexota bacterium]MBL6982099.1 ABC transporter substrate-binding protein [Anaerolineales bacterium]
MYSKTRLTFTISALTFVTLLLSACAPAQPESVTLKLALLPVLDTLPVHVAASEGFFEEQGINVEIIPVSSAPERDSIVTAGEADGMLNEIVSTLFYNKDEVRVQIVRTARAATSDAPIFRILAAAESGIESVADLKGVKIGVSEGTIIEYLTDRLLEAEGFTSEDIATIAVPKIPDRLALLGSGEMQAAMLPDPASSIALLGGANVIVDDTSHPEFGFSVLTFRKETIDAHPDAITGFLVAIEQAVEKINTDPTQYAELMAEKGLVPPPLMATYQVNPFPTAGVPTQAQWDDAVEWAMTKGLLENGVVYQDSVTAEYLP